MLSGTATDRAAPIPTRCLPDRAQRRGICGCLSKSETGEAAESPTIPPRSCQRVACPAPTNLRSEFCPQMPIGLVGEWPRRDPSQEPSLREYHDADFVFVGDIIAHHDIAFRLIGANHRPNRPSPSINIPALNRCRGSPSSAPFRPTLELSACFNLHHGPMAACLTRHAPEQYNLVTGSEGDSRYPVNIESDSDAR